MSEAELSRTAEQSAANPWWSVRSVRRKVRHVMRFALAITAALLLSTSALAQSDSGLEDAGSEDAGADAGLADGGEFQYPDGSVGEGGADRDQQEAEDSVGRVPSFCRRSIECPRNFQCVESQCRYTGVRKADGPYGCGGVVPAFALPLGALLALFKRRR